MSQPSIPPRVSASNKRAARRALLASLFCLIVVFYSSIAMAFLLIPEKVVIPKEEIVEVFHDFLTPSVLQQKLQSSSSAPQHVMTVVVSVYKQPKCLQEIVTHMRTCQVLKEIRVNWFQSPDEIPNTTKAWIPANFDTAKLVPIRFDFLENRLSQRFLPRDWQTDAVFNVDADTFYTCTALELAYQAWNLSGNPELTAVGFHGRLLRGPGSFYQWNESFVPPFRYNTVFITKGGLVHKNILNAYYDEEHKQFRDKVDKYITGEDMLMSFVLARLNVNVIAICLEPQNTCQMSCWEGVESLGMRTSQHRPNLLEDYFSSYGNPMSTKEGSEKVLWQNPGDLGSKKWCFSEPRPLVCPDASIRNEFA